MVSSHLKTPSRHVLRCLEHPVLWLIMCFSLQNVLYYLCKFPQMTSTPSPLLKNPETVIMEIMCHFKSSTASQDSQSFVSVCARQAASFKFGHTRESAGTFVMSQIILVKSVDTEKSHLQRMNVQTAFKCQTLHIHLSTQRSSNIQLQEQEENIFLPGGGL